MKAEVKIKQYLPAGIKHDQKLLWFLGMVIETVPQALTLTVKILSRTSSSPQTFPACLWFPSVSMLLTATESHVFQGRPFSAMLYNLCHSKQDTGPEHPENQAWSYPRIRFAESQTGITCTPALWLSLTVPLGCSSRLPAVTSDPRDDATAGRVPGTSPPHVPLCKALPSAINPVPQPAVTGCRERQAADAASPPQ